MSTSQHCDRRAVMSPKVAGAREEFRSRLDIGRRVILVLVVGSICLGICRGVCAQSAPDAMALVKKFGAPSYAEREQAFHEVIALKDAAKAALLIGVRDTDPEIRKRARLALTLVVQQDLQQQIATFETGQNGATLPGWSRFSERFGKSASSRKAYAAMFQVEPGMLLSFGLDDEAAADAVTARIRQYQQSAQSQNPARRKQPGPLNVFALLMAATHPGVTSDLTPLELNQLRNWWAQQDFQNLLNGPHQLVAKQVRIEYLRLGFASDQLRYLAFNDALSQRVTECLPDAIQHLHRKPSGYAIECVARLGGKAYLEALLPSLDDDSVVTNFVINGKMEQMQSRDMALAWIVNLTGQKPAEYELPHAEQWFKSIAQNPANGINFGAYRFGNNEKRGEMIAKLRAYLAKHPVAPMPVPMPEDRGSKPPVEVVQPEAKPAPDEEVTEEDQPIGLNLAESFEVQKLNRARQLIREQRWGEAAAHLGEIIRRAEDRWFQPQRGVAQYRELRAEAERQLRELPLEGLAAYEHQFGPAAAKSLSEAVAANDIALLTKIARESFHTQAGADAAYRLGNFDFDAGRVMDAAMRFERLALHSQFAEDFEPGLSLKRAMCWSRLGEREQARHVLTALKDTHADVSVMLGGRSLKLFAANETVSDWLSLLAPQSISANDWLMHRCRADRNPQTNSVQPVLFATAVVPLLTHSQLKDNFSDAREFVKRHRLSRIPTMQPLVLGDAIVFRTLSDLRAVNSNGEVLWTARPEDTLNDLLSGVIGVRIGSQGVLATEFLQERLFDDSTSGVLASDGRSVFVVESDRFDPTPEVQRLSVNANGDLTLSTESQDGTNALSAYDVVTGKLVWQRRTTSSKSSLKYLGAPLVIGGNLFVIVSSKEETTLRELDATTGDLRRQWMLHSNQYGPTPPIWWGRARPKQTESPFASSPSYGSGVVVCRTPSQRIVAIDLTTGALRWAYQVPRVEGPAANPFNPFQRTSREITRAFDLDRWCDTSLVVHADSVLVTAPDSNELICLSLSDGGVRWSVPRGDGLFVAAVDGGRVLIAGRNGMRAVRLTDGANAWPLDVRVWPNAAMPSGTGYLANGTYFMPLNSGEVVGVESAAGRFVTRSHKLEDWLPGNLVVAGGAVYSLGLDGLRRLQNGSERIAALVAAAREQPRNAALATELGEAYFSAGRISEGLEHLRVAEELEATPDSRAHLLLRQVLTDSSTIAPELRRSLMSEGFLSRIPNDAAGQSVRWQLQVELARAFERMDDLPNAVQELLAVASMPVDVARLTDSNQLVGQSVARSVRLDAWYQGQLASWLERLNPEQRQAAESRIVELVTSSQPLERRVAMFGRLPEGLPLRLKLVEQLTASNQPLEAELQLRHVLLASSLNGERDLLLKLPVVWQAKRTETATRQAQWLKRLGTAHRDELLANGKRGREMLESEPQDSPLQASLKDSSPWAVLRPKKTEKPLSPAPQNPEPRLSAIVQTMDDVDQRQWLGYDQQKRNWYGLDATGRRLWELSGQKSFYQSYSGTGVPQARAIGPLLVIWTGNSVHALDTALPEAKQLWTTTTTENSNDWRTQVAVRRLQRNQIIMGNRMPRPELAWSAFVLQPSYLAIHKMRDLVCFEPLTGKILWKRDDAPPDADLVGDENYLCAIDPEGTRGFMYRALDGQDAGLRTFPPRENWLAWSGSKLVVRQEMDGQGVIRCLDVIADRDVWSRMVSPSAKTHPVNDREFAVLEPSGRFELIETTTGRTLLASQLPALAKLEGLFVQESFDRLLVFADEPLAAAPQFGFIRMSQQQINVNGQCHAVNRVDGKVAWSFKTENEALTSFALPQVPLMALNRMTQKLVPLPNNQQGQTVQTESRIRVLNARTGDVEFEENSQLYRSIEITHDAKEKLARIRLQQNFREFSFTE